VSRGRRHWPWIAVAWRNATPLKVMFPDLPLFARLRRLSLAFENPRYRIPRLPPSLEAGHRPFQVPPRHLDVLLSRGQVLVAHQSLQLRPRETSGRCLCPERVPKLVGREARWSGLHAEAAQNPANRLAVQRRTAPAREQGAGNPPNLFFARVHAIQSSKAGMMRTRPGCTTVNDPISFPPRLLTRSTTTLAIRVLALAGNRRNTTPPLARPPAWTNWPKSLSSVRRVRPCCRARPITAWSSAPGENSDTVRTSWPAARRARTTAKSQLSSARNRIAHRPTRFRGLPTSSVSSRASVSAAYPIAAWMSSLVSRG
jgi:hypothetical protein